MSTSLGRLATRRVVTSASRSSSHYCHVSSRAFTASAMHQSDKIPSLSDISPAGAPTFDHKQKEFRSKLKAESQSSSPNPSNSSASASASASPAVATSASPSSASASSRRTSHGLGPEEEPYEKVGLGSYSTHTGQERESASQNSSSDKKKGALSSLIYGTEAGRQMDHDIERSFSETLARGKYVHSIVFHEVKPDKVEEYVSLVGGWYPRVANDPKNKVNLVGSWRTEVGDCDTFVHIWEYQRYHGYHDSLHSIQSGQEFFDFDHKLKALINSKRTSLMQEFSFWPTSPPRALGGLFELRSYTLHPGNLLEWETHWRKGLRARKEVMEGVGAWFVQIGDLNTVHHLWQYADLEERKIGREKSWGIEGWSDTVHKTVPLIQSMKSRVLVPMPWSPVR